MKSKKSLDPTQLAILACLAGAIEWFVYRAWVQLQAFPAIHFFVAVGALTGLLLLDRRT
jgi:hypothetical protein